MISVVVPSFNAGRWIAASLDSVLAQTRPPDEVIVVDDGSTDDTADILAGYGDRIRVLRASHGGLAAARNLGLAMAGGDWIAFQDADDVAHAERLAALEAHLASDPQADGVFADGARLDDGERLVPRTCAASVAGRRLGVGDLFTGFPAYYQAALLAREALVAAGPFDPTYRIHPDHDHAFRLFARVPGHLPRPRRLHVSPPRREHHGRPPRRAARAGAHPGAPAPGGSRRRRRHRAGAARGRAGAPLRPDRPHAHAPR